MENLIKGQRLALSGLVTGNVVQLGLSSAGVPLDFACFGLDAAGKLSDDRYMTFFNQPRTPCGGVETSAPQVREPLAPLRRRNARPVRPGRR